MPRLVFLLCILGLCHSLTTAAIAPKATTPLVAAKSAIVMDRQTGLVLWSHNPDQPLPMASTTKIMTAMIILDHGGDKLDQSVTVSHQAAGTGGSSLLAAGDILTLRDLLTSALVHSSNEATVAAAEYLTQGHVPQFVAWMNDKAQMLGLQHTHFVNPHGLFDRKRGQEHYSSARDLAILTRYALTNYPRIHQIVAVGRPRPLMIHVLPRGQVRVENHNKILNVPVPGIPGAVVDGVKTGYVVEAGKCLVSSASQGKWQLIAVVLGSDGQYFQESLGLLHYGFSRYQWKSYASAQLAGAKVPVAWGAQRTVPVGAARDLGAPVLRLEYGQTAEDTVVFHEKHGKRLSAPIQRGDDVGTLTLMRNGQAIASAPAIALEAVPIAWWAWLLRVLALLFIVSISLYVLGKLYGKITKTRRRRRRQLAARSRSADLSGARDTQW